MVPGYFGSTGESTINNTRAGTEEGGRDFQSTNQGPPIFNQSASQPVNPSAFETLNNPTVNG